MRAKTPKPRRRRSLVARWSIGRGLRLVLIGSRFEGLLSAGFRADWFPEPEPNPEPGTESDDLGADWLTEPGTG